MEWNHFLPRCIFGDWPIGQWLTKRQHAIASALQTLAFGKRCLCGWHKPYLPENLLELCWPLYCKANKVNGRKTAELRIGACGRSPEKMSEDGKKGGAKGGPRAFELRVGAHGRSAEKMTDDGKIGGTITYERGIGVHAPGVASKGGKVGGRKTSSQIWESTIDGFRSNAGCVAQHNKANGWDPDARVRIS